MTSHSPSALFRIAVIAVCSSSVFVGGIRASGDEETPGDKLKAAARDYLEARREEREKQRLALIQRALELAAEQKKIAAKKLTEANQQAGRLAYVNEMRNWALGDFEASERNRLPKTDKLNRRLDRWKNSRQQYRRLFLEFPQKSRGAVRSGRALNFFLDACGSFAMDHQVTNERVRDTLALLEKERGRTRDAKRIEKLDERLDDLHQLNRMLSDIGGKRELSKFVRDRIRFQRGDADTQLVVHAKDGALPLDWPSVLTKSARYSVHCDDLEEAKAAAMKELGAGVGISVKTQRKMLYAVDRIQSEFRKDWANNVMPPKDAITFQQYVRAKQFVRGLRSGVLRFVEATEVADVQPIESFAGNNVGQLLVFMAQNGLRFAPSDVNSEDAYKAIYAQLVDYYTDVHGLRMATEKGEYEEKRWNSHADKYVETITRDTMRDLERAMQARPPKDLLDHIEQMASTFSDISSGIDNLSKALNRGKDDSKGPRFP